MSNLQGRVGNEPGTYLVRMPPFHPEPTSIAGGEQLAELELATKPSSFDAARRRFDERDGKAERLTGL